MSAPIPDLSRDQTYARTLRGRLSSGWELQEVGHVERLACKACLVNSALVVVAQIDTRAHGGAARPFLRKIQFAFALQFIST